MSNICKQLHRPGEVGAKQESRRENVGGPESVDPEIRAVRTRPNFAEG